MNGLFGSDMRYFRMCSRINGFHLYRNGNNQPRHSRSIMEGMNFIPLRF